MLTKRQNFLETIHGGHPERFVNQFEPFALLRGIDPVSQSNPLPAKGQTIVDKWGVTMAFPNNVPASFPVHDEEHLAIKDITKWREVIQTPSLDFPEEAWEQSCRYVESIDREEQFVTLMMLPGIFEQIHYLTGIENCLIYLYTEPEAVKELIDYIVDYKIRYAKLLIEHYQPDALFHHDDWGSGRSSFMSPEMFAEFFVPAYKRYYGFYRDNGIEIIVHHSDSYAANLVPHMIDIGIDVFQGCITSNNVPELVKKYGGKISFMGDLNNSVLDTPDWNREKIHSEVVRACRNNGSLYYIPCLAAGGAGSTFPGVYQAVSDEIARINREGMD